MFKSIFAMPDGASVVGGVPVVLVVSVTPVAPVIGVPVYGVGAGAGGTDTAIGVDGIVV